MRRAFLDYQSSTPVRPEVFEAMRPFFAEHFGSPSALHQHGLRARDALARAREQMAAFIHAASPDEIIFTSGGTEAANLALLGAAHAHRSRGDHLVVSAIEHPSVLGAVAVLEKQGFTCSRVPVDGQGRIDPEAVREALTDRTILVAVHHVNHDIGTLEPVREIAELTGERGIPLFVDAVAGAGWLPIDVQAWGVNLLSLSPHRFHGPKGVGVLYRHRRTRLSPQIVGGAQEHGLRAGTENVPAIVGAGVAAEIIGRRLGQRVAHVAGLQRRLWDGLKSRVSYLRLNGPEPGAGRSPANLNVSVEFVEGEGLLLMCDARGLALAAGTACVSKSLKVSHVLTAIGLDHALAQGAVLFSPGENTTPEEIDFALDTFAGAVDRLRSMSPMWEEFQRGAVDSVVSPRAAQPGPNRP